MVTAAELYAVAVTVMALVALAAAIPVLLDIARDGGERLRRGGPTPPVEADGDETENGVAGEGVRCPHCGAENDPGYVYCESCSRRL